MGSPDDDQRPVQRAPAADVPTASLAARDPSHAIPALATHMGWVQAIGLDIQEVTPRLVVAQWDIDARHLQPHGIVHGGVYASVVETCCSVGALSAAAPGKLVVGVENHTSFLRPVRHGRLTARAVPLHAGRRAQLWECNISDASGRLIATGRLRVMCVEAEQNG
jgi:1,4-dihydroxy-2-naphthoyl-CoA hydrolase